MKLIVSVVLGFGLSAFCEGIAVAQSALRPGAEYEIRWSYQSSQQSRDGSSSGSSKGHQTILERVIDVREGGLELEYDLPTESTAEERAREWQFPARVYKPEDGPMRLLNRGQLETRLEQWLEAAKWDRSVCGHWIFTWNAFRIECDPQAVIKTIEGYDLRSAAVREGAVYHDARARAPGVLRRKAGGQDGASLIVAMEIDPQAVRHARAESDVVVGEIAGKPVSFDAALKARAKDIISGTLEVTFDTDAFGNVVRRTTITKIETMSADGNSEIDTRTDVLERHLVPADA